MDQPRDPVECYASHTYPQRPFALWWQGERLPVVDVLAEVRTPPGRQFHVRVEDGRRFRLQYDESSDTWSVAVDV